MAVIVHVTGNQSNHVCPGISQLCFALPVYAYRGLNVRYSLIADLTPVSVRFVPEADANVSTIYLSNKVNPAYGWSIIRKSRPEAACHYLRGLPASERFSRTLPSLLRSRGWVPPPGLGTTTPGLSGLLSAIIPFPNRMAKVPPFLIRLVS